MNAPSKLISAEHLDAYSRRKAIVDGYPKWDGTLKEYAAIHQVAPSTIKELVAKALKGSDNLLDKRMDGGKKVELPSTIAAWCLCFWCDHPKAQKIEIWREVSKMAEAANLSPFSYKQVKSLFKRVPKDMRRTIADGQREGFEKAGVVARRIQSFPNELWQMDATELDLWCLNMATGLWFKPWMTTVIDGYSRVLMAAVLHLKEPTTADALATLSEAILPKGYADYPFFGLPVSISTDNHKIFESADFLDALRRLNITRSEIPNRCPSANGKIERWFHTFKYGLLARLAGYAGQYKGLQKAKQGAVPSTLLPKLVRRYVVDYFLREHSEIACTPWEKWHEALEHAHGLLINDQEIRDAIKLRREFTMERDGILVEKGRHYTGTCVAGLVNEKITVLISPEGRDEKIPVYYNNKLIGELRCVEEDATLSDEIRAERLTRSIDFERLAKGLRGQVENPGVVGADAPVVHSVPALGPVTVPMTEKIPLGDIPTLKSDAD